jgi:hypothetical protein
MRRVVPLLSAVALAGALAVPMLTSGSTASAAPCPPNVLPAPADIIILEMDSYAGSLGQGQC